MNPNAFATGVRLLMSEATLAGLVKRGGAGEGGEVQRKGVFPPPYSQ